MREQINNALLSEWYSYRYDIFRPEDLFGELMSGPHHQDLIALENMLADSVDAVVLAVESWGAVAELGSFASNPRLRKKMVCLVDRQYKKSRSFINRGPLRLLKDRKEGEVLYIDFSDAASDIDRVQRFRNQGGKHVQNVVEAWRCQHCGRKGRFAMSVSGLREARIRELGTPRLPAHTGGRTRN